MKTFYFASLIVLTNVAFSQTITWTGDINNNWNNANNWSPNVVPGAGHDVLFPDFTPDCLVDAAPSTITGLTMSSGYTGNLDLNGHTLNIGDGVNSSFLGGTVLGVGTISITSTKAALFNGTDFGANVNVNATLTTLSGIFTGASASTFGGPVSITANSILLNGSTYNNTASFNKSGTPATQSLGEGGNTFNGTTSIVNTMNHIFRTANKAGVTDNFNGPLTLSLNGTNSGNIIQLAHVAGTHTNLNNNVRIRSNNFAAMSLISGGNVFNATLSFGGGITGTGGTTTLTSGFTINEVDPSTPANEFQKGDLIIKNLTQVGNTAQTLNIRNSAASPSANNLRVFIITSTFNGTVTYSFSNSFVSYSTFFNTATFNKTTGGGGDDTFPPPAAQNTWDGGNTFHSTANFNHYNLSTWVMGKVAGDVFHGNVNLYSDLTGPMGLASHFRMAEGAVSQFLQNVNLSRNGVSSEIIVQFGRGGGTAQFSGAGVQSISYSGAINSMAIKFGNLHMKNSSGLTLNFPATLFGNANLEFGVIQLNELDPALDSLTFERSATVTNASDLSYVDGLVLKRGKVPFVFPIGDGSYHPLGISSPADEASLFSARYFWKDHGHGTLADPPIVRVSDCEYWILNRLVGTDDVTATLSWNDASYCNASYITSGFEDQLRAVRWSGVTNWNNLGNVSYVAGSFPDGTEGNLTTLDPLPGTYPSTLTFGTLVLNNVLPVRLAWFNVKANSTNAELTWQTASEKNNDYFTIERMQNGYFVALGKIKGAGTTNLPMNYQWLDTTPLPGLTYYRLKQTDFDGTETYSDVVALHREIDEAPYPNPVKNILYLDGLNFDEDSKLIVTDLTGRVMYSGEATESLDFQEFVSGIYHLGIQGKSGVQWYSIRKE